MLEEDVGVLKNLAVDGVLAVDTLKTNTQVYISC